jgi:hypothetical protein
MNLPLPCVMLDPFDRDASAGVSLIGRPPNNSSSIAGKRKTSFAEIHALRQPRQQQVVARCCRTSCRSRGGQASAASRGSTASLYRTVARVRLPALS